MKSDEHHVIPQQRIKIARSAVAVKEKAYGKEPTEPERRLLDTPLSTILCDRRNIVRVTRRRHHRAHHGFERLTESQLPRGIHDFAAEYGLESALEREIRLIREAA